MRRHPIAFTIIAIVVASPALLSAQAPPKSAPPKSATQPGVKLIPPTGIDIPAADRAELEKGVAQLGQEIEALRNSLAGKPELIALMPDVQIYHNAVRYPFQYNESLDAAKAKAALATGLDRARQLREGKPQWVTQSGPRGYVSKLDGSVQPYHLILPTGSLPAATDPPRRLDLFCHGRDEKLTELNFVTGRIGNAPAPGGKFVVLLYGRFCNANKLAGEVDCFEAIEDVARRYPIDRNRIVLTGFSMGGGAAWHFTVHYADVWAATSPGAGFAESPVFLGMQRSGELERTPWYQKKLFHAYDCTDWAENLAMVPCIAYAGELDGQILASQLMEKAAAAEGIKLERLIGPKTKHQYDPQTRKELDKRLDAYAAAGRKTAPDQVRFTTWTLRYPKMFWVRIDGMGRHWEKACVDGAMQYGGFKLTTQNVTAVTLSFAAGEYPVASGNTPWVMIDEQKLTAPPAAPNADWSARYVREGDRWRARTPADDQGLHKRPGLQGPIDDAFMDSFLIVKPSGKPMNAKVGAWSASECDHAIDHWRRQFRGEARVKTSDELTRADLTGDHNLILFGDPSSNKAIAEVLPLLPIQWTPQLVTIGGKAFPSDQHAPVLLYPNPLNPNRYIVINSGVTFREAESANNARQIPKLPDYAVVDFTEPPSLSSPGKIVEAGFFGEKWELLNDGGRAQ